MALRSNTILHWPSAILESALHKMCTTFARATCNDKGIVKLSCDSHTTIVWHHRAMVQYFSSCYTPKIFWYLCNCHKKILWHAYDIIGKTCHAIKKIFWTNTLRWVYNGYFPYDAGKLYYDHTNVSSFFYIFLFYCRVTVMWQRCNGCESGFPSIEIPIVKFKWSHNRLIFIM